MSYRDRRWLVNVLQEEWPIVLQPGEAEWLVENKNLPRGQKLDPIDLLGLDRLRREIPESFQPRLLRNDPRDYARIMGVSEEQADELYSALPRRVEYRFYMQGEWQAFWPLEPSELDLTPGGDD